MTTNTDTTKRLAKLQTQHDATLVELERYKLLVESVQHYAIFLLDTEGYVITWNKGAEKNKGYKAHEIIGRHFSKFYLPHDIEANKPDRELELAKRFGRVEDEDWRVRKDGRKFWANVTITALHNEGDGELVGFAKVTRDLTERKIHEDKLRQANTLLQQQQIELERLNNSKDEFISLASHQLRTPATSIKQYLGMLLEGFMGDMPAEQLEHIQKAYISNERQLSIVNNLLKVAQIDAGKVMLRKLPTDFGVLLHSIMEDQKENFSKRGQNIQLDIPDALPPVFVDASYLRMALDNIVDNASKYTPRNGAIVLSARRKGGKIEIGIQDSGVGIAAEDVERLFRKFSRIPNSLSQDVGGSGLGLYWASKVIELHDGTIDVKSEVDGGTLFTISLPIGSGDA